MKNRIFYDSLWGLSVCFGRDFSSFLSFFRTGTRSKNLMANTTNNAKPPIIKITGIAEMINITIPSQTWRACLKDFSSLSQNVYSFTGFWPGTFSLISMVIVDNSIRSSHLCMLPFRLSIWYRTSVNRDWTLKMKSASFVLSFKYSSRIRCTS